MTYADGSQDVGLWCRERLVKVCSTVEGVRLDLEARGFPPAPVDEPRQRIQKAPVIRPRLERLSSAKVNGQQTPIFRRNACAMLPNAFDTRPSIRGDMGSTV